MSAHVPDWVLERHLAGELPEGFSEADLRRDPTVPERLAKLRAENEALRSEHPAAEVAREVRRRLEAAGRGRPRSSTLQRATPWLTLAVAATLVLTIAPRLLNRSGEESEDRPKGLAPHLEVYRKVGESTEALEPGAPAFPGDVLQVRIVGAEARYAAVVSIDGAGAVTLHAPTDASQGAVALPQGGVKVLDRSYALDAAPRFERFVLITSGSPFDAQEVVRAAARVGAEESRPLPLPGGLAQSSFLVRKDGGR